MVAEFPSINKETVQQCYIKILIQKSLMKDGTERTRTFVQTFSKQWKLSFLFRKYIHMTNFSFSMAHNLSDDP